MRVYDKLVRDLIPQIIEKEGKQCTFILAGEEEVQQLLEDKLLEEFNEYLADRNLEELADMLEVVMGMARCLGHTEEELLQVRDKKRKERGGFDQGIVLKKVVANP